VSHLAEIRYKALATDRNTEKVLFLEYSDKPAYKLLDSLVSEFEVMPITTGQVIRATDINIRYDYSYWDSLIIATALESNCNALYSEDMQHDQVIENQLRIINPLI
jgi:predicted nucleic acid-binding protein